MAAHVCIAPLTRRVTLHCAHLPLNMPLAHDYDIVISTSLLHHLHDPLTLWQTILQHGRSGAFVCVMDLLRPASEQEARMLTDIHAANAPEILRQDFYRSLLAAYRPDEVSAQLQHAGLTRLRVETVSDRHWLVSGTLP